MPQDSKLFKSILYAVDTTLFSALDCSLSLDISASSELVHRELSRVDEWLTINRLSINISKTKYMLFHPRRKENFNVLGVITDKHIWWKHNTQMASNKILKYCDVLSRLKNYLPLFFVRTLYISMEHSHLSYNLLTWGFNGNRTVKLQKLCVRIIITWVKYNAHTQYNH